MLRFNNEEAKNVENPVTARALKKGGESQGFSLNHFLKLRQEIDNYHATRKYYLS